MKHFRSWGVAQVEGALDMYHSPRHRSLSVLTVAVNPLTPSPSGRSEASCFVLGAPLSPCLSVMLRAEDRALHMLASTVP